MRSDVDCCLLLSACDCKYGWKPPGRGAACVVFRHKMVLLQFKDNMETKRENSRWSILFSLPFSQHPRFRFPLTALQGEAVVSAVKGRKGESEHLIIEAFRRWLSLAFTSLRWLSHVVGICLPPVRPQPRGQAGGWLLRSWEVLSPLHLMLRKRKGKGFPSLEKIVLGSPCAPASGKEPGRVGAACSMHWGRAAALQHPPACCFSSFREVLLQFAGGTLTTPLIHTLPGEQPFKSCTQAADLAAMARGLVLLTSAQAPAPFPLSPPPQRPRVLGHAGGFCSEREGCCHHPLLLPPLRKMSLCPGAPAL